MNLPTQTQLPPSAHDAALARASRDMLARHTKRKAPLELLLRDRPIELPAGAVSLLVAILDAMGSGRGVTILAEDAELTTVQAARALNVSRPFLIKLLDERALPHRKVGKHRRVRLDDLLAFKRSIDRERESVLDELASEAQRLGMGYPRASRHRVAERRTK